VGGGWLGGPDACWRVRVKAQEDDIEERNDEEDDKIERKRDNQRGPIRSSALRLGVHLDNTRMSAVSTATTTLSPGASPRAALPCVTTARAWSPSTLRWRWISCPRYVAS